MAADQAASPRDPVTAPDPDVIELSAFGPGYGESLLVHLGAGEWMIVDSCRSRAGALPALQYYGTLPENVDRAAADQLDGLFRASRKDRESGPAGAGGGCAPSA